MILVKYISQVVIKKVYHVVKNVTGKKRVFLNYGKRKIGLFYFDWSSKNTFTCCVQLNSLLLFLKDIQNKIIKNHIIILRSDSHLRDSDRHFQWMMVFSLSDLSEAASRPLLHHRLFLHERGSEDLVSADQLHIHKRVSLITVDITI